jgi:hypothetical protein
MPIATIAGGNTHLADTHSIAFDAAGRIYETDNVYGINVFAPGANGNVAPVANIPRNSTSGLSYPWGIALDSTGKIYTLDAGHIFVFPADPVGTTSEAPLETIAGSNTELDGGNDGMTVTPGGTILAADRNSSLILVFQPASPARSIRRRNTRSREAAAV